MSGPQPKPASQRRRKNVEPGFKLLPYEGRSGDPPEWPLPDHPEESVRGLELEMWTKLWSMPQAVEWERMRCEDIVALYVRAFISVAGRPTDFRLFAEVRQLDSKIGLSPRAMRDMRWETDERPAEVVPEVVQNGKKTGVRTYVPEKEKS